MTTNTKITVSTDAADAIQRAGENIETALRYAMKKGWQVPGLMDAALEISAALDIIYPRDDEGERD